MSNNNYIKSILTTLVLLLAYANVSTYACAHFTLLKKENTSKTILSTKNTNQLDTIFDFCNELEDESEDKLLNCTIVPQLPIVLNHFLLYANVAVTTNQYKQCAIKIATLPIYIRICNFRI